MKEIILSMGSPNEAVTFARSIFGMGFIPYKAIIKYDLSKGVVRKIQKLDDYPLRLEGTLNGHEMRVLITPLVAGCSCEGSRALYHILKAGGFPVEIKQLTTIRNVENGKVNLLITRQ